MEEKQPRKESKVDGGSFPPYRGFGPVLGVAQD